MTKQNYSIDVDSVDLLHESISVQSKARNGILARGKSVVRSFKNISTVPAQHERLRNEDEQFRRHVSFRTLKGKNGCKECLVCLLMVVGLAAVLSGMFGLVLLVALHPKTPTISIEKVSNGTLFLYTDANNTILVSAFNLTMVSDNPNANAQLEYTNATLDFSFGGRTVGKLFAQGFRQKSKVENMSFQVVINSTTNFTSRAPGLVSGIRSGFEQQNVTFSISGSVPVRIKVGKLVPSNAVVNLSCNVSFTPSFPPVILAKICAS